MSEFCSPRVALLAAASLAALACNRTPEPVGTSASLTSAEQSVSPQPKAENAGKDAQNPKDPLVCEGPSVNVCERPGAAGITPAPVEPLAHAARGPALRKAHAVHAKPAFEADLVPVGEASGDKTALDEAIQREASRVATQDVTGKQAIDDTATTTGANVAVARAPAQAPSRVSFQSQLPGEYRLERVQILVDGVPAYDAPSPGSVSVAPGEHLVQLIADYQMHDALFSYVDGYQIEMNSGEVLHPGTDLLATARRTGGVTTPVAKSIKVQWRTVPGP